MDSKKNSKKNYTIFIKNDLLDSVNIIKKTIKL